MPTGTFPWDPTRVVPLVLGIGMNYRSHAVELGKDVPIKPVVFSKGPNTICGPGDPILLPKSESKVDYEGELAVVIGPKPCKNASPEDALSYVEGYTVANDVSGRQWQFDEFNGGQWVVSKSFDNFCPVGPSLVPAAQVPDPQALRIVTKLNGEVVQDSPTSDMVAYPPQPRQEYRCPCPGSSEASVEMMPIPLIPWTHHCAGLHSERNNFLPQPGVHSVAWNSEQQSCRQMQIGSRSQHLTNVVDVASSQYAAR